VRSFIIRTKKLKRKNSEIYLGTATLSDINNWQLKSFSHQTMNEFIYIHCNDMTVIKEENEVFTLEIKDGYLLTVLPAAVLDEEFPILISQKSPVTIIMNALLEIDLFKKFIDIKTKKISNNSTKIMTLTTLEKIVSLTFEKYTLDETAIMINKFIHYIEEVFNSYDCFKVMSVKSIQQIKSVSIINSPISWFIILKYFADNHKKNLCTYSEIPNLDFVIVLNDWQGNFFDKDNPLWDELFTTNRKFYPSKENLLKVYEKWKYYSGSL
jgi:hypothetical protein